jgi:hypothetical protein
MRLHPGLLLALLLAACSRNGDAVPLYSYLVTPSGHTYRLLKTGPVMGAEGKKLGTMVSYAAETREIAKLGAEAEELAAALAPEMALGGETSVIVQATVGHDPRKLISKSVSYSTVFERKDGSWQRLPPKAGEPMVLGGTDAALQPPEDASFPYDAATLKGASDAAARWVALVDAGNVDASITATSKTFFAQVSEDQWRGFVKQGRTIPEGTKRIELYRMQTRTGNVPMPPGGGAVVQYELRPSQGGRLLERVMLLNEKDGWRPAGYALQPLP